MKAYTIHSRNTGKTLYQGIFKSFKSCLEQAVADNVTLIGADLRHRNLTNADLDGAKLPQVDFTGTNLTGANLSEAYLKNADVSQTALYNTCLAYSNLCDCDFTSASFGATDITGCILTGSRFSSLSFVTLNFSAAKAMDNCAFIDRNDVVHSMSQPPIVLTGLSDTPMIISDHYTHLGLTAIGPCHRETLFQNITKRPPNQKMS
ncbi:MAG: pentapeptide repeat-containing protein [Bdellovibrionales bacterium]